MAETDFYDPDAPAPEPTDPTPPKAAEKPVAVPEGAETVTVDGQEVTKEEIVASALRPGPNLVEEEEVIEAESVVEVVQVKLVDDSPVDEVLVSVPGIDADADYADVTYDEL